MCISRGERSEERAKAKRSRAFANPRKRDEVEGRSGGRQQGTKCAADAGGAGGSHPKGMRRSRATARGRAQWPERYRQSQALYIRHSAKRGSRAVPNVKCAGDRGGAGHCRRGAGRHAAERHNRRPLGCNSLAFSGFRGQPADFPP